MSRLRGPRAAWGLNLALSAAGLALLGRVRTLDRACASQRREHADLEYQAFHDGLTGLANRGLFMDRVANALERRQGNAAVLFLDLDDFKAINDTLGHHAGDEALASVAGRLRQSVRAADTAARLGGDEFGVLLVDIAEEHVGAVCDRIIADLARPHPLAGAERPVRVSLGVAVAASGTMGAEELVRSADAAMYVRKHAAVAGV